MSLSFLRVMQYRSIASVIILSLNQLPFWQRYLFLGMRDA